MEQNNSTIKHKAFNIVASANRGADSLRVTFCMTVIFWSLRSTSTCIEVTNRSKKSFRSWLNMAKQCLESRTRLVFGIK